MQNSDYEEYMRTVLGYNIKPKSTYYNYNFNNNKLELEKLYPKLNNIINEYINEITKEINEKSLNEISEEIYKKLNIKDSTKETKNIILDLIKIIILDRKINYYKKIFQNRGLQNIYPMGFNPYVDF